MSTTILTVNQMKASIGWLLTDDLTFADSSNAGSYAYSTSLAAGTGSGKANLIYLVQDTTGLAGSASNTYDLTALTDMYKNSIVFTKIKAIMVLNDAATTANLLVGAATTNAFAGASHIISNITSTNLVPQYGCMYMARSDATGWPVTATQKNFAISNAHTSAVLPFRLAIIGES